ncbi:MAG TPA: alkaline phosphatase D family protein [Gaiellaceae bacterium]|nr:alkaline phosphatase D family protein [Gaiellaceae bacterium]
MLRGLLAVGLAALVAPAAAGAAPRFPLGVAAGDVGPDGAILWAALSRPGTVWAEVSRDRRFRGMPSARVRLRTTRLGGIVASGRVAALAPGRRYWYRVRLGRATSGVGSFRTAPPPRAAATVRFAVSGDADGAIDPSTRRPAYNRFEVYGRMAAEGNDFNVNLGDTIYSDSEVSGLPPALTVAAKAAKYRQNLSYPALRRLRAATGLYSHWDDHEFVNDFTVPEHGAALYRAGRTAFAAYAPVAWTPRDGLFRRFRWGRTLELFFLDERSFRSAKATSACGGDLAPTAPQPVRDAFASLAPSLATPVAQGCLDAIADPSRTMLGRAQYERFTRAVAASTATWKVVVNEVPIQQFYALPYDRWEGYAAERERLLRFLQANVRNVVFLTTDAHANFVNEVRLRTLGADGPQGTGIWEVVTGPVATASYSREIDEALGRPGAGAAVTGLFLKPAPPRGVGMACAAPDVFSYAEVRATPATLSVTPKDAAGRLVREATGSPCGPFTLRAR